MREPKTILRDFLVLQNYDFGDTFIPIVMETRQGVRVRGKLNFNHKVFELNGTYATVDTTRISKPVDARLAVILMFLLHGKRIPAHSKLLLPFKKKAGTGTKIDLSRIRKFAKSILDKFRVPPDNFRKRRRKCPCIDGRIRIPQMLLSIENGEGASFSQYLHVFLSTTCRISIEIYNPTIKATQTVEALRAYWLTDLLVDDERICVDNDDDINMLCTI